MTPLECEIIVGSIPAGAISRKGGSIWGMSANRLRGPVGWRVHLGTRHYRCGHLVPWCHGRSRDLRDHCHWPDHDHAPDHGRVTVNPFTFLVGLAFGFLIVASRFSDYTVIHGMLLFREPDLSLVLGSSFVVAMPLLWLLRRRRWKTPLGGELELNHVKAERKHLYGGALVGAGWATAGTCPGPALGMTLGGGMLGIFVMAGLATGIFLRNWVARHILLRCDATLQTARPAANLGSVASEK